MTGSLDDRPEITTLSRFAGAPTRASQPGKDRLLMSRHPLTTPLEVVLYLGAHLVGIVASYLIVPPVIRGLVEAHRGLIMPVSLAINVAIIVAVMLIFLFARKMLGGLPGRSA